MFSSLFLGLVAATPFIQPSIDVLTNAIAQASVLYSGTTKLGTHVASVFTTTLTLPPLQNDQIRLKAEGLINASKLFSNPIGSQEEYVSFVSHVIWESIGLSAKEELGCSNNLCPSGIYYGRGYLQLTHDYNYQAFANAIGRQDIMVNPSLVASNESLAWGSALFFWTNNCKGRDNVGSGLLCVNSLECTASSTKSNFYFQFAPFYRLEISKIISPLFGAADRTDASKTSCAQMNLDQETIWNDFCVFHSSNSPVCPLIPLNSTCSQGSNNCVQGSQCCIGKLDVLTSKYTCLPSNDCSATVVNPPTSTGQCGPTGGNAVCAPGYCCSQYGWCGLSPNTAYCGTGCQSAFGTCAGVSQSSILRTSTVSSTVSSTRAISSSSSAMSPPVASPTVVSPPVVIPPTTGTSTGQCGPSAGNAICVPGMCCSRYGWCGSSPNTAYCGTGCQSAFGTCNSVAQTPVVNPPVVNPPVVNPPVVNPPVVNPPVVNPPSAGTSTGQCGPTGGNAICVPGMCCSRYGWCGSSPNTAYCGTGCQSAFGTCNSVAQTPVVNPPVVNPPVVNPPSAGTSTGQCGPTGGNAICVTGLCCSRYGWCGSPSAAYCGTGCQSAFGRCD